MKELEVKTYNFAVQGIGLAKSLEKELSGFISKDLMKATGAVSIKFIDAVNAKENEDFANNLKECFSSTKKSLEILNSLEKLSNESLDKQKDDLIEESTFIIEKLEQIIQKLIY